MKFRTVLTSILATITLINASTVENKFTPIIIDDGLIIFLPTPSEKSDLPSGLSEELVNTLSYMGNEERLAYDVYNRLYKEWGIKTFTNIANKSEIKHIEAVQDLIQKYKLNDLNHFTNVDLPALGYMNTAVEDMEAGTYDISKIQRLYDDLVSMGSRSEIDALKVGCIVEVVDINDLDEYIHLAEASNASDVVDTFTFLRKGSYNHYWSFDKALKQRGVTDGCCKLGTIDGVNYCHPEYPSK
ncbi:MAG: DUF2202 domain-containing protein [Campylobacterota bacterium]|nr:DUF2202 domain-containing protein [Campylobacterota bacterium]